MCILGPSTIPVYHCFLPESKLQYGSPGCRLWWVLIVNVLCMCAHVCTWRPEDSLGYGSSAAVHLLWRHGLSLAWNWLPGQDC